MKYKVAIKLGELQETVDFECSDHRQNYIKYIESTLPGIECTTSEIEED